MEYTFLARLLEEGKIDTLKKILKDNLSLLNDLTLQNSPQLSKIDCNTLEPPILTKQLELSSISSITNFNQVNCNTYPIPREAINAATPMIHNTLINRAIVMTKDIELIELLLDNGADIYQYNLYYQNAISLSLSMASENKLWTPIADLIMSHVPLDVSLKLGHENKSYNLAMIYAVFCFENFAIDTLNKGVLPYEKNRENNIFLIASERNQLELIDYLIKHYPNHALNLPKDDTEINYYFLVACYQKNETLCQYLMDHTIISEKTLEHASYIETLQSIESLIQVMKEKYFLNTVLNIENECEKKQKKI